MGRGRPRKPTAQHKLEGTFRHDRHAARLDEGMAKGSPVRPGWVKGDALDCWNIVTDNLPQEALAILDTPALEALCFWFAEFRYTVRAMYSPKTTERETGKILRRAERATRMFASIACRFGMTPSDRAKMLDSARQPETPTDPLLAMLERRSQN